MNTTELMNEAARRRLDDLDSGRAAAVPGDEVFEKVCRRLGVNEISTRPQAADRRYEETLAERVAAADRGAFASEEEVARFFVEHGE